MGDTILARHIRTGRQADLLLSVMLPVGNDR